MKNCYFLMVPVLISSATAQQKQDAINDYAAAYSEVFGISIESALVIAVNKSIGGAHYTGDKGSNIVLNDASMKNAQYYMNTLAHEVTHGLANNKDRHPKEY